MKRFIFGFDAKNPDACAAELRRQGIDAIVVGHADEAAVQALRRESIELYLCFGAFAVSEKTVGEREDALDANGRPKRWFHSGCPNDSALYEERMAAALRNLRNTPSARGLFVDGARFASFASAEGPEAFFTCFCPRCMSRMRTMGLDAEEVRKNVARLMKNHSMEGVDEKAIRAWFNFRAASVKAYFERFAARVHALPGNKRACGFVFAPSLAAFVGQTMESCAALDVISPMLYRSYPHPVGTACLGHEWSAVREMCDLPTLRALTVCAGGDPAMIPEAGPEQLLKMALRPNVWAWKRQGREKG